MTWHLWLMLICSNLDTTLGLHFWPLSSVDIYIYIFEGYIYPSNDGKCNSKEIKRARAAKQCTERKINVFRFSPQGYHLISMWTWTHL